MNKDEIRTYLGNLDYSELESILSEVRTSDLCCLISIRVDSWERIYKNLAKVMKNNKED